MTPARRFFGEPIQPEFNGQPGMQKRTGCPVSFSWRGSSLRVAELLSEWHDYARRWRAGRNMRPAHAAAAFKRGSRGVGRDYYKVRTDAGRVFTLYYDRAPKDCDDKTGAWILREEEVAGDG